MAEEAEVRVRFELDRHVGVPAPAARMWIDMDANGSLTDAEELDVEVTDLSFSGSRKIPEADGVAVFVKYLAERGATWTLEVTVGGAVAYKNRGVVGEAVGWVLADLGHGGRS